MDQTRQKTKEEIHQDQFNYRGTWCDKSSFRAFVYNKDGEQTLADNYKQFEDLTTSGLWYESQEAALLANQKGSKKDGSIRSNS